MINVCVPVLKRYDLLRDLVASLPSGVMLHIINNGRDAARLSAALAGREAHVLTPPDPMGVAESWNWFLANVPEERVIVNDDVTFAPDSLAKLLAPKTDMTFAQGIGFSCFVIRNRAVKRIGVFDESISPGYAYYEDDDYMARMRRGGVSATDVVDSGIVHLRSSTLEKNTEAEMQEHHRRFHIARANFVEKWGMMPGDLRTADEASQR